MKIRGKKKPQDFCQKRLDNTFFLFYDVKIQEFEKRHKYNL